VFACRKSPAANLRLRPDTRTAPPLLSLTRSEPLPEHALDVLQKIMMAHGEEMDMLFWSALLFDYDGISEIATGMAQRRQNAAAEAGATDTLNRYLPEEFFTLQNEFEDAALQLSDAAQRKDDKAIANQYGRLVTTCVSCHAVYLKFPLRLSQREPLP
jgi:cytochrome c556